MTVGRTPKHEPLLTVPIRIAGMDIEALVDCGSSGSIVGPKIAKTLGVWKRAKKIKIRQGDGSTVKGGSFVVNTTFTIPNTCAITAYENDHLKIDIPNETNNRMDIETDNRTSYEPINRKYTLDAEVLNIGRKDIMLGLSWLKEQGLVVNIPDRCLENRSLHYTIPCSVHYLPTVLTMNLEEDPIEEGDILMMIDATERYHKYATVFSSEQASRLPERKSWDHEIRLRDPNSKIPSGAIYKTTWEEDLALQKYLEENLPTGKVRRSRSSAGAPILFVRKKDGSLRLCVDYRGLNRLTIPNKYPLPLINDLLDQTKGAKWLTRLDLKNSYNLIRIAAGDEWKTAFKTKRGLFEYTVMPFGLMNAPATFQEMMDTIFGDLEGVIWYLDDILIFGGETEADHQKLVEEVLSRCVDHGLAVNLLKSEFHVQETIFLGHIINGSEVRMDPDKLKTISEWPIPTKKKEVQSFLGFANYYRRFIENYSQKVKPLTELTKDIPFSWGALQQEAFDNLRSEFMSSPILKQFDRSLETILETDASNQVISGILSQYHDKNGVKTLHPVEFHAKTLDSTQRNWPIHDKELFAIVDSFRRWRSWLVGVEVKVYTDHQGLQYFNTKQKLNSRQAEWNIKLSEFNYMIHYRPGSKMGKVDAITRRSGDAKSGIEEIFFKDGQLLSLDGESVEEPNDIPDPQLESIDMSLWEMKDELRIVPPEYRLEVLRQCHDSKVAGHWGKHRTQELVSRNFIWDNWKEDVASYVAGCIRCQKAKSDRHSRQTKLIPMPTGVLPWQEIAMDFIGELPESEGYNAILVITDRFTKMQIYIPAKTTWTAEDVADAYILYVFRHYGVPKYITSDRGPQFASAFWNQLNRKLDVLLRLSTAHHPQTDGLSERAVQTLKQYLRIYTHDRQDRWVRWLPLAEFAYNSTVTSTHGYSPFRSLYGFDPQTIHVVDDYQLSSPAAEEWLDRMVTVHNQIHDTLKRINDRRSKLFTGKVQRISNRR